MRLSVEAYDTSQYSLPVKPTALALQAVRDYPGRFCNRGRAAARQGNRATASRLGANSRGCRLMGEAGSARSLVSQEPADREGPFDPPHPITRKIGGICRLDIADDGRNDWIEPKNGGTPRVNKEAVLRSKIRIEARQFHMARLHPQQWGERQQIDIKDDWALLTKEERRRKADELIEMIRELREPPPQPPPLVYPPEEPDEEPANPGRIGSRPARSR